MTSDIAAICPAQPAEAAAISARAIRSKARWGYTPDEMKMCAEELTLSLDLIEPRDAQVLEADGSIVGVLHAPTEWRSEHRARAHVCRARSATPWVSGPSSSSMPGKEPPRGVSKGWRSRAIPTRKGSTARTERSS